MVIGQMNISHDMTPLRDIRALRLSVGDLIRERPPRPRKT